jgi:hypothetical protein
VSVKRFTRPDGVAVLINPDNVEEVMPADVAQGHPPGARAVIMLVHGGFQAVRETVAEVEEVIK